MKNKLFSHGRILGLLAVILMVAVSCEDNYLPNSLQEPTVEAKALSATPYVSTTFCGEPLVSTLYAGQHIDAGTVTVGNDGEYIYVTYETSDGWLLTETHLYVLDYEPTQRLVPGRAPYKSGDISYVTSYTVVVPFNGECDVDIWLQSHAAIVKLNEDGEVVAGETAYGGDIVKPNRGSWYGNIAYSIQCCVEEPPVVECDGETAWAAGSRYVTQGNWATFTAYEAGKEVVLYAGQHKNIGTVTFSAAVNGYVTITIQMNEVGGFQDVAENVKIQDYEFAPSGNPSIGLFDHKGNASGEFFTITVPENNFYGVHVDALVCM